MFTDQELSDDDLFELLGNDRRRLLLHLLFEREDGAHLEDLSREIVAREAAAGGETPEGGPDSVYATLYQTHIPALEEHGVVEYDDATRVVSLGERAAELDRFLRDPAPRRRGWAISYLVVALSVETLVLAGLVRPAGVPGSVVPAATVGGAAALFVLTTGHCYDARVRRPDGSPFDPPIL